MDRTLHAAQALDAGAHDLRNDIATLRMAANLVDDTEVAESIAAAVADLQVRLERAVVAARIDLGRMPDAATLAADELVRLGAARARREGLADPARAVVVTPGAVQGPGVWLERLVADVHHGDDDAWVDVLAAACGARVDRTADPVVVDLPAP